MSELVAAATSGTRNGFISRNTHLVRLVTCALAVSVTYYIGAKIGFALTFQPHPVSTLWPPNAILFASLLLSPKRWWWAILLAVFPAHLLTQVNANVPPLMILCWFVSNCTEALLGASLAVYLIRDEVTLDTTDQV